MTRFETITLTQADGIATLTLNRPDRRNAVNAQMSREVHAAMTQCEADPGVAVTILTGAGASFCAGMDLSAFGQGEAQGILHGDGHFGGFVALKRTKPVIAAVNGPAVAGGFEMVLACDMAVAADTAIFGLPEAKRGLIGGAGGVFRLAQRLPIAIVNEMILTGDAIDAARAAQLGLVNRVVAAEAVMGAAHDLARRVAANAPMSIALGLELARTAQAGDEAALWQLNDRFLSRTVASKDAAEGARAFLEKRAPDWQGR